MNELTDIEETNTAMGAIHHTDEQKMRLGDALTMLEDLGHIQQRKEG